MRIILAREGAFAARSCQTHSARTAALRTFGRTAPLGAPSRAIHRLAPRGHRSRLTAAIAAGLLLLLAAPAGAQGEVSVAPPASAAPRPVGLYAGVEPGEAEPPPAYHRLVRQRERRRAPVTILTWPGFAPLGDGGSRFFVQTTEPVMPQVRTEEGRVVLVFPNTTVHLRNSTRWLETRFFNTPVLRARLERRRRDMAFVMHMRAPAVPRISTEPATDGSAFHYVYIDFPPGDYAPVVTPPPDAAGLPPDGAPTGPPPAPARELDPSLRALDEERPPGLEAGD